MLHDFQEELQKGPLLSHVENVEEVEVTPEVDTFKSFEIN